MSIKFLPFYIALYILSFTSFSNADIRLNWQLLGDSNIAITYKDENHIAISASADVKFLKLHGELYLLQMFNGFKVAYNLSEFNSSLHQKKILNLLPNQTGRFLPIMVIDGSTRMVQGFEGDILLLKGYHKSVMVVSSRDSQHLAIKNALVPLLVQLIDRLPNLPNRQLIDILKHNEFGLPLQIGNELILTQSEDIMAHKNTYSLQGYKVISSLNDLVF